jgi:hypothetical protein
VLVSLPHKTNGAAIITVTALLTPAKHTRSNTDIHTCPIFLAACHTFL